VSSRQRGGPSVRQRVDSGLAELIADPDRPRAWTLLLDGTPQSHVDLDDPAHLEFEYMRRIGHLIDLAAPPGQPLRALHLGAGGLTLARYIAATRPGSAQLAVEADGALAELVRRNLPLPQPSRRMAGPQQAGSRTGPVRPAGQSAGPAAAGGRRRSGRVRVRVADARTAVEGARPGSFDLVIADLFTGGSTPAHLTSAEFAAAVARALAPGGSYAVNVGDGPPLTHARARVATVRSVFPHACLISDPAVLRGRRFGNLVIAAGLAPLPASELTRRVAADPFPARLLDGDELERFAAGAAPIADALALPSPAPPPDVFAARRGGGTGPASQAGTTR
jgi:spermidine synthase